jgi:thiamine-phosphate pyrophosphorylase
VQRRILCLVTDPKAGRGPLPKRVAAAIRGGVDWVQVRDRSLGGAELLALLDELRREAGPSPVRWLVNRRVDVALAGGADGAHLGFDAMPAAEARVLLGPHAQIGVATHGADELREDEVTRKAVSYAHLAPIYAPLSKESHRPPLGLEALERAQEVGVPILAQGGITAARVRGCIAAGAAGVAVTGEILAADDPEAAARALRAALEDRDG